MILVDCTLRITRWHTVLHERFGKAQHKRSASSYGVIPSTQLGVDSDLTKAVTPIICMSMDPLLSNSKVLPRGLRLSQRKSQGMQIFPIRNRIKSVN